MRSTARERASAPVTVTIGAGSVETSLCGVRSVW